MRLSPPDPSNPLQMCFRTTGNTTHHCLVYDPQVRENPTLEFHSDLSSWQFAEYRNVSPKEFSFAEPSSSTPSLNICNYVPATSGTVIKINGRNHDAVTCQKSLAEDVISIKCVLSLQTEDGDKSPCFDIAGDLNTAFWACLGLRAAADAFFLCAFCLLEGITLRTIQTKKKRRGIRVTKSLNCTSHDFVSSVYGEREKHDLILMFTQSKSLITCRSVGGITVSIAAFQAVDPGSTPGRRKFSF
ncbi:MFS_1_like domain-containing protein [Trichonephila clavipes]|uniref:MFS_1_like domain-containing protein n=1 Tax=Trichonephila clavipes TaxID=2585209 RepID=A0A8X6RK70_TRICX|nr:MFS_1_like domain-containing protein [Trichonephila clavipes]